MAAQPMVCSLRQALSEPEYQQSADQFLDQKAVMIVRGCTRPNSPKGEAVHLVQCSDKTTYHIPGLAPSSSAQPAGPRRCQEEATTVGRGNQPLG